MPEHQTPLIATIAVLCGGLIAAAPADPESVHPALRTHPLVRDDDGTLLEEPRLASFITSPAPNAGAAMNRSSPMTTVFMM